MAEVVRAPTSTHNLTTFNEILRENSAEIGVLTGPELKALFASCPGVWSTLQAYAAFLLAAATGMRRGEILALTWKQISFSTREILIDRAVKGNGEIGKPKWEKIRSTFLPARAAGHSTNCEANRRMYYPRRSFSVTRTGNVIPAADGPIMSGTRCSQPASPGAVSVAGS